MLHYNTLPVSSINYPYCFKHKVFNQVELEKIIIYCDALEKTKANIRETEVGKNTEKFDSTTRVSDISWITIDAESKWIFDRIAEKIDSLNHEFYQHDLFGFNAIQYAEYNFKQLGKYDYHMDMHMFPSTSDNNMPRKLSASLLLNNTFEGGEFEINTGGGGEKVSELVAGTIIVFPSYLIHRVKPVTKGIRRSLTVWCVGPKFK